MTPSPEAPDRLQLLIYDYVEDVVERRGPLRPAHLELIVQWRDEGKVVMGGAIGDPPHGGVIVFRSDAEEFARQDPYVVNGLVTEWRVEPWTVVV